MGIDVSRLAPWAQKQIAQKVAAQVVKREDAEAKPNKYHNVPSERTAKNGAIRFASKREAARYDELMLLVKAGRIRDLKLQRQFTLQEAYTTPEGERVRAIRYVADFTYYDVVEGREIVEDVKGGSVTQTSVYNVKKKLLKDKGIDIQEVV